MLARHSQRGAENATVDAASSASMDTVSDGDGCAAIAISATSAEARTPSVGGEQQRQQQPLRGQAHSQQNNQLHEQHAGREGLIHGVQVKLAGAAPASWLATTSSTIWQGIEEYALRKDRDPEPEEDKNWFGSSDAIDVGIDTEEWVATRVGETATREVITLTCSGGGDGGRGSNDNGRNHGDDQAIAAATEVILGEEDTSRVNALRRAEVGGDGAVGKSRQGATEDWLENRAGCANIVGGDGNGTWKLNNGVRGGGISSVGNINSTRNTQRARTIKIWDPVQQLQLFSAITSTTMEKPSGTGKKAVIESRAGTACLLYTSDAADE